MIDSWNAVLAWEKANPERMAELCLLLESFSTMTERRKVFSLLTDEEKNGVIPELTRRKTDKIAPVGSLVTASNKQVGINIVQEFADGVMHATYFGQATVIGQPEHGSYFRLLYLHAGWRNREGNVVYFAKAHCDTLAVVE